MFTTSGATNPGVPHLTKRYSGIFDLVANPRSAMIMLSELLSLKSTFSGLRSLCMMFLECMCAMPSNSPLMMILHSSLEYLCFYFILSYSYPPSRRSRMKYNEFSVSNTSCNFITFGWSSARIKSTSFNRASFPFSWAYAASLENAFTANIFSSSSLSARYTDAKLPFPIFLCALYNS
jgi:hypothetical protein